MGLRKFSPANKTGIRCRKLLHRMQQLSKSGKNSPECQIPLTLFYTHSVSQMRTLRIQKIKKFTYGSSWIVSLCPFCYTMSHQGALRAIFVVLCKEETASVCCYAPLCKFSSDMLLSPNTYKCFTLSCSIFKSSEHIKIN